MTEKRGLLLLSGGIDSPVAGHLAKSAGFPVGAIHFSSEPLVGPETEIRCRKIAESLGFTYFSENIAKDLEIIAGNCKYSLYFVLQKRLLLRKAEALARREGFSFLITGDSLGQVSSQTLSNLSVVDSSVSIPVVRPLLSFDKEETIALARRIGTYELSKGPEACCVLGPKHPATVSTVRQAELEEEKLRLVSEKKG